MANLVYATDYDKSQAIEVKQSQVNLQEDIVAQAESTTSDLWAERKAARAELNQAKEYLINATNEEEAAAARKEIQLTQQAYDSVNERYQLAADYRNEQTDILTKLQTELENTQTADINPSEDPANKELAGESTAGDRVSDSGETVQVEDHTPWVTGDRKDPFAFRQIYNIPANKPLFNGDENRLMPGWILQMPGGGTYKVVYGDTLTWIAQGRGKGVYTRFVDEAAPEPPAEPTPEQLTPEQPPQPEPLLPHPPAESTPQERVTPRRNPLHDFATYTYSIALYILSKEEINTLTTAPESWEPGVGSINTCLIASGGKNTGRYARNKNFTDDFYFDNLKMTTMIGMNNRSKSSNAIELSFTILEPYGMSLLDRIMQTAEDIRAPNFKAMPYLLEVEFYGFDDSGAAVQISDQRKRIPIQIIEMKIKVGSKGAEYAIKAIPWNHQALSQSAATTPVNLEVKASTVAEFFKSDPSDRAAVSSQDAKKLEAQSIVQRKEQADKEAAAKAKAPATQASVRAVDNAADKGTSPSADARVPTDAEAAAAKGIVNHAFAVSSFCGGVNAWYTDLIIKKLRATKDEIAFEFHDGPSDCPYDIAKAKITVPENKDISRSAVKEDKPEDAAKAAAKNANRVFTDATAFAISAGTSIPQVIDMVMRNSTYITDQIKDPKNMQPQELAEKEGKPLWWYRVVPTVEINEYDLALNKFSCTTTYHITPYKVFDSKHPNGPAAAPRGAIKEYYYSYTGKNLDVLDLQIDFDTLFYTAVTAGAAKWQADQLIAAATQQDDAAAKAAKENPAAARELVNRQLRLVSAQPQSTGVSGTQNGVKSILAADVQKGLYSTQRGDMLNLKLKITGDPELIKQDDVYTNPGQDTYAKSRDVNGANQNGSVDMDSGEILALVKFKTILDMDEQTGLPRKNVDAANSVFSGLYRMLDVENVFAGGKFEQTINLVRVADALNEAANNADKGKEQKKSEALSTKDDGADKDSRTPDSNEDRGDDYNPSEAPPPPAPDPAANNENEDNSNEDGIVNEADDPEEPDATDLRTIDEEQDEVPIDEEDQQDYIGDVPAPDNQFT